ncbi:MAG: ROK family transcriptional regulator [Solirubrobacterales bacterium]
MTSRGGADLIGRRSEALVLGAARRRETIDRASLAAQTELTPQAVSNVLARLTEAGLVEAVGTRRQGVGKPVTEYRMRDGARQAIGVHVTRRGLRLAQVDLRGNVGERLWFDLEPGFGPDAVIDRVREGLGPLAEAIEGEGGTLVGVGIGMIGPLDHRGGVVRDAYGLSGWHDVPLGVLAEEALGLPVLLDKDVSAAAAGQAWALGEGAGDTALILIEAGVGAGLWLRDAAYRGAHTNAGEFGHAVIDVHGPRCVCGREGCLEAVHGAAVEEGDVEEAAAAIAVGALNLVETLDVQHVVLCGTDFLRHEDLYLGAVTEVIERHRPSTSWRSVNVSSAAHGEAGVAAGAGTQVLQRRFFEAGITSGSS